MYTLIHTHTHVHTIHTLTCTTHTHRDSHICNMYTRDCLINHCLSSWLCYVLLICCCYSMCYEEHTPQDTPLCTVLQNRFNSNTHTYTHTHTYHTCTHTHTHTHTHTPANSLGGAHVPMRVRIPLTHSSETGMRNNSMSHDWPNPGASPLR